MDSLSSSPPTAMMSRGSLSLHALHQWEGGLPDTSNEDGLVLYEHGRTSDAFTLLLQGRALIRTGAGLLMGVLLPGWMAEAVPHLKCWLLAGCPLQEAKAATIGRRCCMAKCCTAVGCY